MERCKGPKQAQGHVQSSGLPLEEAAAPYTVGRSLAMPAEAAGERE